MECQHDGYHAIRSSYDRHRGVLTFVWICELCGSRLGEAGREEYRPAFNPHDNAAAPHAAALAKLRSDE
jgi:hypothetical protein